MKANKIAKCEVSKYVKMGEKLFYNIRDFLKFLWRIVRQKVMATLARGGGNRGGKLSCSGLGCHDFWVYICITRVTRNLARGQGDTSHCLTL